jgi:beta-galactosidase
MFHGGTSFGWMNGANIDRGVYEPDVTSYDYDAPLDESGRPTKKYTMMRDAITRATGVTPPPVPDIPSPITVHPVMLSKSISLWKQLPKPIVSEQVQSMEHVDQAYGYILYRTTIHGPVKGDLMLDELHDYARIYANGIQIGALDRRLKQNTLPVDLKSSKTQLDILVENSGRVNFTIAIRGERAGITKQVTLADKALTGWKIYPLPMLHPESVKYKDNGCTGACFYRGTLHIATVGDTFLDTSQFSKGFVWVNGHPLGRIWSIGPQKTLYLPAPWLKQGDNDVIVFDLDSAAGRSIGGLSAPVLDSPIATVKAE